MKSLTFIKNRPPGDWTQSSPAPDSAAVNNPGLSVIKDSPLAGQDTITLTVPLAPGGKSFARLKVIP